MNNDKAFEKLQEIYQHLCNCQDLAEDSGDWELINTFKNLRNVLNNKMYSRS